MFLGLLLNVLIFGLFIFGVKKIFANSKMHAQKEGGVRRFFQIGLLFGLVIISAIGVSGLLGRLIPVGTNLNNDRGNLAMESAFTVVGVPILLLISIWVRNTIRRDSEELLTLAWNLYLTAISITSLALVIDAQFNIYRGIFGDEVIRGKDLSQLVVWGALWYFHFRMHKKVSQGVVVEQLLGSAIGLIFSFVGLLTLISTLLSKLFSFQEKVLIFSDWEPLKEGLVALAIGAPIWFIYWIKNARKLSKDSIWYAYVLLVGVGIGLLISITATSFTLYSVLVWFFGDVQTSASTHFNDLSQTIATAITGLIVLTYHREVLQDSQQLLRTDVRRVYEYVISAIGLVSAAGGVTLILVSIIESLTNSSKLTTSSSTNTLIAALTLIFTGGTVWLVQWRLIQSIVNKDPKLEQGSIVRRIYLLLLFGVVGVTAVIVLLITAYTVFYDLFQNGINLNTLNKARYPLSIFISAIVISKYHWDVFKIEKDVEIYRTKPHTEEIKLHFFVELKLKPRSSAKVIDVLNKYAAHVRKEKGCERLDVLVDPKIKNTVYLYEIWSSSETHQTHLKSEGFAGWKAYSDPLLVSFEVKQLSPAIE